MLLALLLPAACDPSFDHHTTVPQRDRNANLAVAEDTIPTESINPLLTPVTTAKLFAYVTDRARNLAQTTYSAPDTSLSPSLERMDYEQYRSIRFRPEAAIWHNETPFEIQLFHPGFLYRESVRIHLVHDQQLSSLQFDKKLFRYDGSAASIAKVVDSKVGYAGFRIHYPLNSPAIKDEVVVFLGASYFRLLGQGHVYGLSSRGLAVDTALRSGEEFPSFREFWLIRPGPEATTLTFYALLDSPSVTGAYRFHLDMDTRTGLDVEARLYARQDIAKLGVAPLSSMFLYGLDRTAKFDDFRPQVHDSDGLLMHTSKGEWIWRPLNNGPVLQVTSLHDETPHGFGLVQRDRDFNNYLDIEANYHRRPSEWVTIEEGDWGSGSVELLAIPSNSEFNDNIAAYWVPDKPFMAGEERRYYYRLMTFDSRLKVQTLGGVKRTRIGRDALPGQSDPPPPTQRRIIVDFEAGGLSSLRETDRVEAQLTTSTGQTSDLRAYPLPDAVGWRVSFRLVPNDNRPADMELYLTLDGRRLTETWRYVWYPDRDQ